MRLRRLLALAVLALLLPTGSAGSARDPEIRDASGDVRGGDPSADILAAWFVARPEGLEFRIQILHGSERSMVDHNYWAYFTVADTDEEVGLVVGLDANGVLHGWANAGPDGCLNCREWNRGGIEAVANGALRGLTVRYGEPATIGGLLPYGLGGVVPEATLEDLVVGSSRFQRQRGQWNGGLDRATTDEPFEVVPEKGLFPILVPAWVLPTIIAGTTTVGLAGGWGMAAALARRPPPPPPAPREIPVRAEPRPPGKRFQREPPAR